MTEGRRAALTAVLSEASRDLPLYRLSAEWLTGIHPLVELTSWAGANVTTRRLAFSDPHGRWIEWLGDRTAARPLERMSLARRGRVCSPGSAHTAGACRRRRARGPT